MNLLKEQSWDVVAEQQFVMNVTQNMLDVQTHRPTMGLVQEQLLGTTFLSMRDTMLTKEEFQQILTAVEGWDGKMPTPAILKPKTLWTGKQLISCILPRYV